MSDAALVIAGSVEWQEDAFAEARHLGDDVHDELLRRLLEARKLRQALAIEELVVDEPQVAQGSLVFEHR